MLLHIAIYDHNGEHNMMTEDGLIFSRGSAKSGVEFAHNMTTLYKQGKLNKLDYYSMLGAYRIMVYGEQEDKVAEWVAKMMLVDEDFDEVSFFFS